MKGRRLEANLEKHGGWLFIAFMLIAVVPLFMYKSEFNAPFKLAFAYLSIPICAISFYVYLFQMPKYRSKAGTVKGSIMTLLFAAMAILMSGGYVLLANALGPDQREIAIRGKIVETSVSRGRSSTSYWISVDDPSGKNIELEVTRQEYDQLKVGQQYSQAWKSGWLGLLYR